MNLLLVLSALLSALTGVQAGARVSQAAAVAVSRPAPAVANARVVRGEVAGRPATGLPFLGEVARAEVSREWRLAAAIPPFASRRRE